jgi:hypothetical protein
VAQKPAPVGSATCPNGKTRRRTEIDGQSPVSPGHCRASFHRPFCLGRSSVRSCRRHPRIAIDSYWRAHPIRADRLARSLAARSGAPHGWTWRLGQDRESGLPTTFRVPPAPYRERAHTKGPGFCCVCGQPVHRYGWHIDLWDKGINKNAHWHRACVIAWQFWSAPSSEVTILRRLHSRCCSQTGGRLWKTAEVDHRVPLFRVWSEHRDTPWPELLYYWGPPNLQMINRDAHAAKCAAEARDRRAGRRDFARYLGAGNE